MTRWNGRPGVHRRRMLLAGTIGLAMAGLAGIARADPVDISVIDRNTGQPLHVWRHDGRLFVAGQTGANYCLRVANHTGGRVLVVMSVDGVNILTGETAGTDQRGYVYKPYQTYDQCGWRKSEYEIAAFAFTALPDSYAARTGRPAEVGVVGIAVFYERVPPPPPPAVAAPLTAPPVAVRPLEKVGPPPPPRPAAPASGAPVPAPAAKPVERAVVPPPPPRAAPPSPAGSTLSETVITESQRNEKLGTAHGALETSVVHSVSFVRASASPAFTRQIEYDSYDNLVAAGVIPPAEHQPQSFPGGNGFVPDPPPLR